MKTRSLFLSFYLLWLAVPAHAQVPKKTVVEHFTNTKCSICASRNPGFYANLGNQPGILHLAIHPSSPYSTCLLNNLNVSENDARTNYYGVYGGTPRLVINGDVIPPSADYSQGSLFAPYTGQSSPASIRVSQTWFGSDSLVARVTVKTAALHQLGALSLFVALAQDTVFYNSPNGEQQHYDVFIRALGNVNGNPLTLPASVGDSVVYTAGAKIKSNWQTQRVSTVAILQESGSKQLVQAGKSGGSGFSTGIMRFGDMEPLSIYPNPGSGIFTVNAPVENALLVISNALGESVTEFLLRKGPNTLNLEGAPAGVYTATLLLGHDRVAGARLILLR